MNNFGGWVLGAVFWRLFFTKKVLSWRRELSSLSFATARERRHVGSNFKQTLRKLLIFGIIQNFLSCNLSGKKPEPQKEKENVSGNFIANQKHN